MAVILALYGAFSYANINCVSTHFDEKAFVKYVIDGDTIVLSDNRHIRLIGINTPELSHNDKKTSEEGAEKARSTLIELLEEQAQIHLVYGEERFDKHGRTLAHIYDEEGLNIQSEILGRGLAMPLRIPPNLSLADCYDKASLSAKRENRGLWASSRYKPKDVLSLSGSEKGFYFIFGKVERVTESRSSIWVNLENNVALRIHKDDLNFFNKNDLMSLEGKTIEANGWLYKRNKQSRMRIRHELDLKLLN
ncbi:MAG: thermonuclease family protein [Proteobacteria bacterium]|nr:thermonuclease family protein [Pseudomonadota bacterium]